MAGISSPGIGSGLDVNTIVNQLMAVESRPLSLLAQQKSTLTTKFNAFSLLQSYVDNVRDNAAKLASPALWSQTTATSSDAGSVGASISGKPASGSYSIVVDRLAQSQVVTSDRNPAGASATVGAGTLKIEVGTRQPVLIEIGDGEDTLEGIRNKINATPAAGVTASIVNDTGGARLVLQGTGTGTANAFRVTAVDGDGAPLAGGLAALNFDPAQSPNDPRLARKAQDALVRINGVEVVSTSNTLENTVDGLKLTLSKASSTPVEVSVAADTEGMKAALNGFIKAYNDLNTYLNKETRYDEASKKAGPLQGDAGARTLQSQLRTLLREPSGASSVFARLPDIGFDIQQNGSVQLNQGKLSAAMDKLGELARAFTHESAGTPASEGFGHRFRNLAASLTEGLISSRNQSFRDAIRRNEQQQERVQDRLTLVHARLLKQYTALDTKISSLASLNSYVSQQMAALSKKG
ncbi:flagellar filament capping protein FliD [Caldimonas tepidiphila]|uniref:flagellar filament capping protein FliD n=1 Tax=Caldimonas tepidiphila TaxID=2315841 RepID=UPI000E5BE2D6|nr:flagellar filament capping protein FliD [Caldimonas tepidiphila]